jgi:hypothetical protein
METLRRPPKSGRSAWPGVSLARLLVRNSRMSLRVSMG